MTSKPSEILNNIVKTGQIRIGKRPAVLRALAISSCVAIALYDPQLKLGGLAHAMFPYAAEPRSRSHPPGKFADSAIALMIRKLVQKGTKPNRLVAKLAGGASLLELKSTVNHLAFGMQNVQSARIALKNANIPIVAEDVGKNFGRTVHFYLSSGKLLIRKAGGSRRHWREL